MDTKWTVISRFVGGPTRKYVVGAPLALGTIGTLPRPLMSRSIAINMRRSPDQLKLFDETDRAFIVTREAIQKWAAQLTSTPSHPRCKNLTISEAFGCAQIDPKYI
jgi:hypothetical protein